MAKAVLVGCGMMGQALLRGWQQENLFEQVIVVDPSGEPAGFQGYNNIAFVRNPQDITIEPDIIILAVKPQIIKTILSDYQKFNQSLFISIVAGTSLKTIGGILGNTQKALIRAMPNTPAAIGEGITVLYAGDQVSKDQKELATQVLSVSGQVEWVEDENLMHAITALSGSGPAYVFHLIEAMAKAGEQAGLSTQLSMKLARQTVIGATELAKREKEKQVASLRDAVTSPGGTTEAGLSILMSQDGGLTELMTKTVKKAKERSIELDEEL